MPVPVSTTKLLPNKKHVLFLGNNDESTHTAVSDLATRNQQHNHGLIDQDRSMSLDLQPGFYHTSIVDLSWGALLKTAQQFDLVVMLDQPADAWSHSKCLQATFKFMCKLESLGTHTAFRCNSNVQSFLYWSDLVKTNPSVCIFAWINYHQNNNQLKLCVRDSSHVTNTQDLTHWQTDAKFGAIRQRMLAGKKLLDHCQYCYDYEKLGIESYRQFETIDYAIKMNLSTVEDFASIEHPYFYEINVGNHCNIKCRSCMPASSRPIELEFRKHKINMPDNLINWKPHQSSIDQINIHTLTPQSTVYFQGGEPTIMPEVVDFLQRCHAQGRTDFDLTMTTNAVKISDEFLTMVDHFSRVNFSISLDGYGPVNDYWRWGSSWNQIIDNMHKLQQHGHSISINTVPGVYNVTNLHLLFEFLDREFPLTAVYLQLNHLPYQSAFIHPMKNMVIESMHRCQQTSIYNSNGKSCQSGIDAILKFYSSDQDIDLQQLRKFFEFNDQLDQVRGSRLEQYIPELAQARTFVH